MKYLMTGRIYPERTQLSVSEPIEFSFRAGNEGTRYQMRIFVAVSQVIVNISSDDVRDLDTIKNMVSSVVSSFIDAYSYLEGRWQTVEITSAVNLETGEEVVFGVEIPVLAQGKAGRPVKEFHRVLTLSMESAFLRRSLASLRTAMASPDDCAFFCYHAVETLSNHFRQPTDSPKSSAHWERMRNALRIEKDFIIAGIKKPSDPLRHGTGVEISNAERAKLLLDTWKVVDRFVALMASGGDTLDINEFPLLCFQDCWQELGS